ncbi:MAG: hypothetical protein WCP36_07595 [Methanomicrobiales archaeon]
MAGKKTKPSKAGKNKVTKATTPVNKKSLGATIKEKLLGKSK